MEKKKRLVKLPQNVRDSFLKIRDVDVRNSYIKALREEGWTLASISEVTGMTRERIRQIAGDPENTELIAVGDGLDVPSLPFKPVKEPRVIPEPSPENLARLMELQPLAQQVRSNAKRFREEAEEYTNLLWKVHKEEGVSLYRLSKALGVTHSALRFRLVRYGYMTPANEVKSKVYQAITEENRAKTRHATTLVDKVNFIR